MFFGRENELRRLDGLWRKSVSSLVTIRGRRRIGKSTLVYEFARRSGARFIKLEGLQPKEGVDNDMQLAAFGRQLARQVKGSRSKPEDWFDAFRMNYHVIPLGNAEELAAFNAGWSEVVSAKVTRQRADVIRQMKRDPDICTIDADNGDRVTRLKKGVIAYVVRRHTGNAAYSYGCWVLREPSMGTRIMVQ